MLLDSSIAYCLFLFCHVWYIFIISLPYQENSAWHRYLYCPSEVVMCKLEHSMVIVMWVSMLLVTEANSRWNFNKLQASPRENLKIICHWCTEWEFLFLGNYQCCLLWSLSHILTSKEFFFVIRNIPRSFPLRLNVG